VQDIWTPRDGRAAACPGTRPAYDIQSVDVNSVSPGAMPESIRLIVGTPGFLPQEVGALADLPFEPHLLFGFRLKGIATGHQCYT
jgi:hypothetical protein